VQVAKPVAKPPEAKIAEPVKPAKSSQATKPPEPKGKRR
jgi:hypothetical protein